MFEYIWNIAQSPCSMWAIALNNDIMGFKWDEMVVELAQQQQKRSLACFYDGNV